MFSGASRMLDDACHRGVFAGASLMVSAHGRAVHESYHGLTSIEPRGVAVCEKTFYDLASLTKVLATSSLCILAVQNSELDLYTPIRTYLPHLSGIPLGEVTPANLLEHSSGLVAWVPFFQEVEKDLGKDVLCSQEAKDAIRKLVSKQVLQNPPGKKVLYSDLGFILLDQLLETVCGNSLDELFRARLSEPLGIEDLFFIDLKNPKRADRIRKGKVFAATQNCPWRKRVLVGEVHDQNTWAAGGVSGQAGLFGRGRSVSSLCQEWLRSYKGESDFFQKDLLKKFWARSSLTGSTRALGFDTKSAQNSQAGTLMGAHTVGHLGYTGTSIWIDPEQDLSVVLLSNRIHPSVDNESIKQFRPIIHEAIIRELRGDSA